MRKNWKIFVVGRQLSSYNLVIDSMSIPDLQTLQSLIFQKWVNRSLSPDFDSKQELHFFLSEFGNEECRVTSIFSTFLWRRFDHRVRSFLHFFVTCGVWTALHAFYPCYSALQYRSDPLKQRRSSISYFSYHFRFRASQGLQLAPWKSSGSTILWKTFWQQYGNCKLSLYGRPGFLY